MNRENKRKTFEKGYYKTHACNDTFTCKVCGRLCTPQNPIQMREGNGWRGMWIIVLLAVLLGMSFLSWFILNNWTAR